ncbi:helix-turn-helix domain-containing protein [Romboutsia sp.]|uniref:helix-turn-helix domain-containing protein n=1 Tax=Romboutsia sp. TaxID=1965302 RepID=UPI003F2D1E33
MSTFGDRFKKLRLTKNLTQEQLAEEINKRYGYSFSKATISQYENNRRTPEITAILKFVEYFNTSLDYLLCNDSYTVKEMSSIYNINTSKDTVELEHILAMINNMVYKNEISLDRQVLSNEELKLFNNCFEIGVELVKRNRLNNI